MPVRASATPAALGRMVARWRLWAGAVLWLAAMFCLAFAAEGAHKNEGVLLGAIPITLLTLGFVVPRRAQVAS